MKSADVHRGLCMAAACFLALLLVVQCALSPMMWLREGADVHAYRIAAAKVAAGVDPYLAVDGNRTLQYLYPPGFVLTFSPLLRIEGARGLAWWSACGFLFLAGIAACVLLAMRQARAGPERTLWLAALLLFGPAWRNLMEGQVNGIVIVSVFAGILCLGRGRAVTAGILFAFAAQLKVLPGVVLLVLFAQKQWRASLAMVAAGILLPPLTGIWAWATGSAPTALGTAADLWVSWIRNMVAPVAGDAGSWIAGEFTPWNHSFVAVLHRWFDPETAALFRHELPGPGFPRGLLRGVAWLAGAVGLIATWKLAVRTRNNATATTAAIGLALVMINLTHAQTWEHHLLAMSLWLPLLGAARTGRAWIAASLFGGVFSLPAALVLLLPPGASAVPYGWLYEAGRYGIPTAAILAMWGVTYRAAWLAAGASGSGGQIDRPDDVETPAGG